MDLTIYFCIISKVSQVKIIQRLDLMILINLYWGLITFHRSV